MPSVAGINALLNNPNLSPREKARIREQLIASGAENTFLHLGAPTPEVVKQLTESAEQQNDVQKKFEILKQTQQLIDERGIVLGNSSTRPELSKQKAQQVFGIQQEFTKLKSQQVADALASPEFQAIKQAGTQEGTVNTTQALNDLLNRKGIAVPKYETEIVNELAQADIQGDFQTSQNINNILSKAGFTTSVSVQDGLLSGLETNPILQGSQEQINQVISGAPSVDSFQGVSFNSKALQDGSSISLNKGLTGASSILASTALPSSISDIRFTDLPALAEAQAEGEGAGVGGGILGLLLNPIVLAGVAGVIGIGLLLKSRGNT
jgi:hypothetical protein